MLRRPPRSTQSRSSAASDVYKRQILPLQFKDGTSAQTLNLDGTETFDISGLAHGLKPQQELTVSVRRANGREEAVPVICRIDTPIELEYYQHGGILPYILRQLAGASGPAPA